jgi:hypothetical protein
MSQPNTNPLTFNSFITNVGVMAVEQVVNVAGVNQFVSPPLQQIVSMILNYAELRLQRDLDMQPTQSSNMYTLTQGVNILPIPFDDFVTVQTIEVCQLSNNVIVNAMPLLPVSNEFIQNVFSGVGSAGTPQYFSPYGSNFADASDDIVNNILLGPCPNFSYPIRVKGTSRMQSLFQYAVAGIADTSTNYISAYYPDLLLLAAMIYISGYQRNFSSMSDSPDTGATWEKQYQALRIGAVMEEDRKRQAGSGWSGYSTPTSATPTR